MGQGNYERQRQYVSNPKINKPIAEIYADLDAFTYEIYDNEPHRFGSILR